MSYISGWRQNGVGRWTWGNWTILKDGSRWALGQGGKWQYFKRANDAAKFAHDRERLLHQTATTEAAKRSAAAKKAWATRRANNPKTPRARKTTTPPELKYPPGQRYLNIDD